MIKRNAVARAKKRAVHADTGAAWMDGLAGLAPAAPGVTGDAEPFSAFSSPAFVAPNPSAFLLSSKYWFGCCTPSSIVFPCVASNVMPHASW
jgi:hypothetical protein